MKMTDGRKMVEITMKVWNMETSGWGCDISNDFFEDVREFDNGVAVVADVDYCVEAAEDWENGTGDYYDLPDDQERMISVEDITTDDAETIACTMRHCGEWDFDLAESLCKFAGMSDEWGKRDEGTFESIINAAADKLGVEVY